MKVPTDLKYAKSDEWIRIEGDTATVGVSDYAQDALSDVVYIDLPLVGTAFEAGKPFGSVESVKAQSDVYLPVSGTVTEVNEALTKQPELINQDPYGQGWILKLKVTDAANLSLLLDAAAYEAYCATRSH
jgi:glycine cleavage system H protein